MLNSLQAVVGGRSPWPQRMVSPPRLAPKGGGAGTFSSNLFFGNIYAGTGKSGQIMAQCLNINTPISDNSDSA